MGIFNFGKRKKDDEYSINIREGKGISPIASFLYESTRYSLYKINEGSPFYFVESNGMIIYAFALIPYVSDNNSDKIVFYSRDKYVELKFIYILSSSNDLRDQEAFYLSNYKDIIKKFNSYEFEETFEDDKLAGLILSQSPYDVLEATRKISISGFKNTPTIITSSSKITESIKPENIEESQPEKITLKPEEVEEISMTELSQKVNKITQAPEMKANPNYQIGYLLDVMHEKVGEEDAHGFIS